MNGFSIDSCMQVFQIPGKNWFVLHNRDNQWGFEYEGEFRSFATPANCMPLLPLLEFSYLHAAEIVSAGLRQAGVADAVADSFPFEQLIQCALTWDTSYWSTLAVQWLENGYPMSDNLKAALAQIALDKRYSQNIRHRAAHFIKQHLR